MRFSVQEVNQAASGGSFVCIFDADIELNSSGQIDVAVETVDPPETDAEYIESACEAIRAGAAHVLEPRGQGAAIRLTRLVVNALDFKPSRFTLYTARELMKMVGAHA